MAKPLTRCPECSSKITNRFECRNCGLLFDRYFKAQTRKRKEDQIKAAQKEKTTQIINIAVTTLVVVIVGIGVVYYYLSNTPSPPLPITSNKTIGQPPQTKNVSTAKEISEEKQMRTIAKENGSTAGVVVNAIASIETSWGAKGIGIFIKEDKLITSKHLVVFSTDRFKKEVQQFEKDQELIDHETATLQKLKKQYQTIKNGKSKSEIEAAVNTRQQQLEIKLKKHKENEAHLTTLRRQIAAPDIVITLSDGRNMRMALLETSPNYDLALLTLPNSSITAAQITNQPLNNGDQVYTIGKNGTSIKAVFTGYSPEGYLQTNSSIIPAFKNGPLVDAAGNVHGVSITSPSDQNNIGLAIPIATVKQEFGL